jgi:hypothetical protein
VSKKEGMNKRVKKGGGYELQGVKRGVMNKWFNGGGDE